MDEQRQFRLKRTFTFANGLVLLAAILLGLALFSGAWFSDDALRLWRVGLDWIRLGRPYFNPGLRLMDYGQPLWVLLLAGGFALGGRLVTTVIAMQFLLFCGGAVLLWGSHRLSLPQNRSKWESIRGAAKVIFVGLLLAMSNSFREYINGGLEFALIFFLLALLVLLVSRRQRGIGAKAPAIVSITAAISLLLITRYDLIWALAPVVGVLAWQSRAVVSRNRRLVALGCTPLALWLIFAQIQYRTVFPNGLENMVLHALPRGARLAHGKLYLLSGIIQEPFTFLLIAMGLAGGIGATWKTRKVVLPLLLSLGALAYLGYTAWSGGDSVSGRMLCPAAILSAAALACAPAFPIRAYVFIACYACIFFDLGKVSLWNGTTSRVRRTVELFREWGIVDDYALEHARHPGARQTFGLLRAKDWKGHSASASSSPMLTAAPGWDGMIAGPGRIIQDWRSMGPLRPDLHGIIALSVEFQPSETGVIEPVLSFGEPTDGTLLMAEHLPGNGIRFQIWRPGSVPVFSRAIPAIDMGVPHRLVVGYGPSAAGRESRGRFVLEMDGVLLKDVVRETRRYNFDEVVAGWNVEGNPNCAPSFKGRITSLEAADEGELAHASLQLSVPRRSLIEALVTFSKVTNSAEPIVVTGTERMGDIVFVRRVGPGRLLFGQEHWGQAPELGPVVDVDDNREHRLQVALGSLFTQSDAIVRPDSVQVNMDGRSVFASRQVPYPFKETEVSVLDNPLAGSYCGRDFLGSVASVKTMTLQPLVDSVAKLLREETGPVSMTLRFDGSITGRGLGLFEIGVPGAGDIVYVIVRDRTHVQFYYDHWGYGGITGREVEIDPAKAHVLTIEMGSLAVPDGGHPERATTDRAILDGQVVLEGKSPSSAARSGSIHLFDNALVSSNVSALFDGTCLGVARGGKSVSLAY
jgi:hypothetical protein